jgi:hypothetical protein
MPMMPEIIIIVFEEERSLDDKLMDEVPASF